MSETSPKNIFKKMKNFEDGNGDKKFIKINQTLTMRRLELQSFTSNQSGVTTSP
jgi:hypothetical protein